jgi:hypothetical protein
MGHAWAVIAKNPVNGLVGVAWKKYDECVASSDRIAFENEAGLL